MKQDAASSLTPFLKSPQPGWSSEGSRILTQLRSSGQLGSAMTDELIAFANKDDWQPELLAYAREYAATVKEQYAGFTSCFIPKNNHYE